jgi:polysaccharide biosynthesis/export protein
MRQLVFLYLISAIFLTCSSCSDRQYQVLFQQKKAISDTSVEKSFDTIKQYRIQPQDILEITNIQNSKNIVDLDPSLNASSSQKNSTTQPETFQVEEDGTVALTGLGHVKVAGLTRPEAQKKIEDLYHKTLLKNPIISLKIINLQVTLLGEVKAQGNYVLTKDRTTLVQLIGEAGGLTDKADEKNIEIIRGTRENPKITEINLDNIGSINDPKALLQSGDIVYVAQNRRAARGENLQNFSSIVQPILILLNTALIIFTITRK